MLADFSFHTSGIHPIGYLGPVYPEFVQVHQMDRLFIGIQIITAHVELPCGDIEHQHPIRRTQIIGTRGKFNDPLWKWGWLRR
jgi:hypothetical protein